MRESQAPTGAGRYEDVKYWLVVVQTSPNGHKYYRCTTIEDENSVVVGAESTYVEACMEANRLNTLSEVINS